LGLQKFISSSDTAIKAKIEPLPSGYGMTLGNALRRVLLSSLPGTGVVAIRVHSASHEYTSIPGMKDSVLDFILNIKNIVFRKHTKGREVVVLEKKGEGPVTGKNILVSHDVEILNPDMEITHLTGKDAYIKADIMIEKGVGYVSSKEWLKDDDLTEYIHTDTVFSPVEKVRYEVNPMRVGENTDLDSLEIEVETNGSMLAEDALKFSANILTSYFSLFNKEDEVIEPDFVSDFSHASASSEDTEEREAYTPIEILNFSPRTLNALINGEIGSIEQLLKCGPTKLQSLRGFGKKAMDEVEEALEKRGLGSLTD
jgi:DNA-directed RNA polymerase subunit alpha